MSHEFVSISRASCTVSVRVSVLVTVSFRVIVRAMVMVRVSVMAMRPLIYGGHGPFTVPGIKGKVKIWSG